ncbi:hypothetical protein PHYBLDRAFT_70692 [Phycomyces blakesleeanus NRRL 1555(-)]|uniref:Uncharacterized protein n=1 Tax=Phycomyces blakesleeanus (strain ATCC 8743b / DSM 1359 / FGSC 10004 / NBRC 33097 / NRRL 1555) TaxID=763407 RepID=A0A167J9Z3_PHYB8|nr:hypothetical protein PHYBLDRAFT_70692 [Phycomyces blakesleeanus NRRL 1555(-)]OAD65576.1 hypothetical protein PHYBLDRAFT_70692 [Phycomyces blakesleeanus NRRL 1555(-)]|eukprot:XP_018283616.1 hypothetical protein PHYBLDRAFT_70692 [Phycomyces blakesleeanus NRRL 1555(-)]
MLLVPSVQVKHQGSDQSPWLSVSIPSRSSFKVQVKVHGFQIKVHGFQVYQTSMSSYSFVFVYLNYPFHPGQASRFKSRSTVSVSIPSRSSFKVQVKVHGFQCSAIDIRRQGCDLPAKCSIIQVNQQYSDLPSMCSANHVKRPGSHLPAMVIDCSVIQVKHLGSDRQSMVKAIQVKHQGSTRPSMVCSVIHVKHQGSDHPSMHPEIQVKRQGPDHPSMVISIKQHYGHILTSCNILLVFSRPDLIYLQSPAIQVKHQDSDLPAMVIGITKIDEQSHSALFISSVESTKIMLHGSGFSPWL